MSSSFREKIALHNLCQKTGVEGPSCIDAENEIYESLIAYLLYDPEKFPTEYTHPEIKTLADEFAALPDDPTKSSSMYVGAEDKNYLAEKQQFEKEERDLLESLLNKELNVDKQRVKEEKGVSKPPTLEEEAPSGNQHVQEGVGGKSPPTESPGPPGPRV